MASLGRLWLYQDVMRSAIVYMHCLIVLTFADVLRGKGQSESVQEFSFDSTNSTMPALRDAATEICPIEAKHKGMLFHFDFVFKFVDSMA